MTDVPADVNRFTAPEKVGPRHQDDLRAVWAGDPVEEEMSAVASLWRRVRRRWWLAAAGTAVGLCAALIFLALVPPRYTAEAVLSLDTRKHEWTNMPSPVPEAPGDRASILALTWAEVARLKSWTMALEVADALSLAQDPDYDGARRTWTAAARAWASDAVEWAIGLFSGRPQPSISEDTKLQAARVKLARAVLAGLKVDADRETGLVELRYSASSPAKAARIASAWVKLYVDDQIARKRADIERATAWASDHLAELRRKVDLSAAAVQAFRAKEKLATVTDKGATIAAQQVSNIGDQIDAAMGELAGITARLKQAQAARRDPSLLSRSWDAMESKVIQQLRIDRSREEADLRREQTQHGPLYPEVQSLKGALAGTDAEIAAELDRIVGSLGTQRQAVEAKLAALRERWAEAQATLSQQTTAEGRLTQLQSAADADRSVYDAFLVRAREVATLANMQEPDSRILSPPALPEAPSFPRPVPVALVGSLAGLLIGCMLAVLMDTAEAGFRSLAEIERRLGVRAAGIVPSVRGGAERAWQASVPAAHGRPRVGAFVEMLHALRAGLAGPRHGLPGVLLVTSALPGEGKTVTAIALARLSAVCGLKTLLVDCDLARPAVRRSLGLVEAVGLADVLEGRASLAEAVREDPVSRADVLTAGMATRHPAELLGTERVDALLDEARRRYDLVILDSAPLLAVADTALAASAADATLLVVRWRRTPRSAVGAALRILHDADAPEPVCALTRVDVGRYARHDSRELRYCLGYVRGSAA